jgi:hypothetical protein
MIKTSNNHAKQVAVKQRLLERAKALSNVAEVFRCPQVTLLICETVAFGVRAEAEIFQAAYGDPGGRKYWDANLSEPLPVYSLAYVLSAHVAEKAEQLEMVRIAIIRAFRDAAAAGERWFTGETAPLLAVEDSQTNFEGLGKVKVHPRAAVEWLLSKPKREHLVPECLRRFLQSGGEPANANANAPTAPRPVTEKIAERFVTNYIDGEQAAGRSPTLVGLEAAAKKADMRGGREHLRAAFRRSRGAEFRRGRPPKASTKIAEK